MLYKFFRIVVRWAFRFYFRRITVIGKEHIPYRGAVLMLCNHPSSFLEAMLLACFQHRTLHFLVRGDMFEKKWLRPILKWTYQIPIYRKKDGFEKLRSNKSTFEFSYDKLAEKRAILIFPEASTEMVRYLRPLQKGAARLAIGAIEERPLDELIVIPCGVNFRNVLHAGEDALVIFGKGISIAAFMAQNGDASDRLDRLTSVFAEAMEEVVLSIPAEVDPVLYDGLTDILSSGSKEVMGGAGARQLHDRVIKALRLHGDRLSDLLLDYSRHSGQVRSIEYHLQFSVWERLLGMSKLILSFFMGLPGALFYLIPLLIARWFSFTRIRSVEFIPPVRLAISAVVILLQVLIALFILPRFMAFHTALFLVILSLISLYLFANFIQSVPEKKHSFKRDLSREKKVLRGLRQEIVRLTLAD